MKNIIYENKSEPFILDMYPTLSPQPHLHKELEIIYVIEGGCVAWADRKSYKLKKGDFFLCFPNQIHYYEFSLYGKYVIVIPNPEIFFGLKDTLYDNIPVSNVITPSVESGVDELFKKAFKSDGKYKNTLIIGLLNELFGIVMPKFELKPRIKTDNSTIKDVLKYCTANFTEDITLDDVADNLHLSKYHISHLFNEKLSINFNAYINMLRINMACDLLEDTDKKVADVSEEVGFGSIRSFNRAFLQIIGENPLKYRSRHNNL